MRDAEVLADNDGLALDGLRTTAQLAECRSRVRANLEHVQKAKSVTASLRSRLDGAAADISAVQSPIPELEARMPTTTRPQQHLDHHNSPPPS